MRELGKSGVRLTQLGFGSAPLGELFVRVDEPTAAATLKAAWDLFETTDCFSSFLERAVLRQGGGNGERPADLGRNRRLDNFTGGLASSQTHGLYTDDLAVTAREATMQISRQEK